MRLPGPWMLVKVLTAALLIVLAIGPAVWLVAVALSPPSVPINRLPAPSELTLSNFTGVWADASLARPLLNSLAVTAAQAGLNVLLAALAAYPLARMRFRGRSVIFVVILSTLMVPEQVIVVPLFRTIVAMGLYDTLLAVVLPFGVTAFGIYLCQQSFAQIPADLEEAARIDGASAVHIWWHVMLPLARPTLATLAVFSMIGAWSNLLWPLIVLQSQEQYTLPVAINQLLGVFATHARYAYAASVIAMVPVLAGFVVLQRFFERGLLGGAIKG
jgi:putative chitobiose transport system permease protein